MAKSIFTNSAEVIAISSTGVRTPTGEFYVMQQVVNNTLKRIKPRGLDLLKVVSYNAHESRRDLALYSSSTGQFGSYQNQVVPENFDNATYQSARKGIVTKLRLKVKGEEWNLSTFLGELPETLEYFKTTLSTLVRTYRAVKRGDLREIRRMRRGRMTTYQPRLTQKSLLQVTASKWLEWRYAITPLMLDFDAVLKMLHKSSAQPLLTRVVTGEKVTMNETRVYSLLSGVPIHSFREQKNSIRLGMYYRVNPNVQAFKKLGLLNPVATLWELVPLSFVVDWFIPIGQFLGSLDAMAGVSVWSSWESQAYHTQHLMTSAYAPGVNGAWQRTTKGFAFKRGYIRSADPSLAVSLPSFSLSLSSKRLLDGLALTKSILLNDRKVYR